MRYILQRINTNTFTDPKGLMENICGVTGYLRGMIEQQGGDAMRETTNVVPTKQGENYYPIPTAAPGGYTPFCRGHPVPAKGRNPPDFYESAVAFGNFQRQLAGHPAATLHETIRKSHHTVNRYANFEKALVADVRPRQRHSGRDRLCDGPQGGLRLHGGAFWPRESSSA